MTNYNNRAVNAGKLMSELGIVHINRYIDNKWKPKKRAKSESWRENKCSSAKPRRATPRVKNP